MPTAVSGMAASTSIRRATVRATNLTMEGAPKDAHA